MPCPRSAYCGVVVWAVSANLEATCCWRLCLYPKLYLTPQKKLGQPSHMQNWDRCAIICHFFSLLLHWLRVSLPKGALTPLPYLFPQ